MQTSSNSGARSSFPTTPTSSERCSEAARVTASIGRTDFKQPVYVGEIAEVTGRVAAVGRTSIAVQVELWAENIQSGERRLATVAMFAMVAVGPDGKPIAVSS